MKNGAGSVSFFLYVCVLLCAIVFHVVLLNI